MSPAGYVSHRVPGRIRIRIPERRADAAYFADLARRLPELAGVAEIQCNPATASVLIGHTLTDIEPLERFAEERGLFRLAGTTPRLPPVWEMAGQGLRQVDRTLSGASGGAVDFKSLLFLLLLGLAGRQAANGHLLGPAATLVWYAMQLTGVLRTDGGRR